MADADERVFATLDDLEPSYRARAEALGLIRFGAQPVWDALHSRNAIAVYAHHQGSPHPDDSHRDNSGRCELETLHPARGPGMGLNQP